MASLGSGVSFSNMALLTRALTNCSPAASPKIIGLFRPPYIARQRPESTIVVFQDLQVSQAVEYRINDGFRPRSKPFDPVLSVALGWCVGDFFEDGVEVGVAGLVGVDKEEGVLVSVDAEPEREIGEDGAGDGAVQVPAGHLVEIAALLVEEHEDELLGQSQGRGLGVLGQGQRSGPPGINATP